MSIFKSFYSFKAFSNISLFVSFTGISSSLQVRYVPWFSLSKVTKEGFLLMITFLSWSSTFTSEILLGDIVFLICSIVFILLFGLKFCLEIFVVCLIFTTFNFEFTCLSDSSEDFTFFI